MLFKFYRTAIYRFITEEWNYIEIYKSPIYYIDIIALLSFSFIIKCFIYKNTKREIDKTKGLHLDIPITQASEDLLNRDDIAKDLAIQLMNTETEQGSYSIGIVSPWGNGKTSFLNLLCNHLNKEKSIPIYFNPWIYEKEKSLIDAFFLQLSEDLKPYNPSLSTELMEYAHLLSSSNNSIISIGAKLVECTSTNNIQSKYENINRTIKRIGKLVVVIIDDLDRLDKDEVFAVLKLIRNSANFSNIAFVTAYDREYLTEALNNNNVYRSNIYLDKIFQYEFTLPIYDRTVIKNLLYIEGKKFICKKDLKEYGQAISNNLFISTHIGFIDDYLTNIRDVIRFINALRISYERLKGDIIIKDLMNIELLRLKYPFVYNLLAQDYNSFLYIKNEYRQNLVLWNKNETSNHSYNNSKKDINEILEKKYTTEDKEQIMLILSSLFKESYSIEKKAISNADYIARYFYYTLLDSDLSEEEFYNTIKLPFEEIKNNIDKWAINKSRSLTLILAQYKANDKIEYQKVVRSIFYLGKVSNKWTNDNNEILSIINNSQITDKEEHIKFIEEVFFENGLSIYVSKFIYNIFYNTTEWNFIIPKNKCIEYSYKMFQISINNNEPIQTIYDFFKYTKYIEYEETGESTYKGNILSNKDANQLFVQYTLSHLDIVLPTFITKTFGTKDVKYYIGKWVYEIWEGQDNFETFIEELPRDNDIAVEFSNFMNKCKNEESAVIFSFQYISVG